MPLFYVLAVNDGGESPLSFETQAQRAEWADTASQQSTLTHYLELNTGDQREPLRLA